MSLNAARPDDVDTGSLRRVCEPVARVLLIIAAAGMVNGLAALTGLPVGPASGAGNAGPGPHRRWPRSAIYVTVLPVLAVLLVALASGMSRRAGYLALAAAAVQAIAAGLGVISLLISVTSTRVLVPIPVLSLAVLRAATASAGGSAAPAD